MSGFFERMAQRAAGTETRWQARPRTRYEPAAPRTGAGWDAPGGGSGDRAGARGGAASPDGGTSTDADGARSEDARVPRAEGDATRQRAAATIPAGEARSAADVAVGADASNARLRHAGEADDRRDRAALTPGRPSSGGRGAGAVVSRATATAPEPLAVASSESADRVGEAGDAAARDAITPDTEIADQPDDGPRFPEPPRLGDLAADLLTAWRSDATSSAGTSSPVASDAITEPAGHGAAGGRPDGDEPAGRDRGHVADDAPDTGVLLREHVIPELRSRGLLAPGERVDLIDRTGEPSSGRLRAPRPGRTGVGHGEVRRGEPAGTDGRTTEVHVHIDRVEVVRAAPAPAPQPARAPDVGPPAPSRLDVYLEQRQARRR